MYPLIILGAGASHDYLDREQHLKGPYKDVDLNQYRPPLLKDLFNPSTFNEFLKKHPDASVLASDADGVVNFEEYLTKVQDQLAPKNKDRYRQLISLKYYLCELFNRITEKYYRPKNYFRKIITNINDYGGNACFINFNYDLLFETNISAIRYSSNINSYIEGKIKVIKIHGAYNWFYEINTIMGEEPSSQAYDIFLNSAENFVHYANFPFADKHIIINDTTANPTWNYKKNTERGVYYYLPALAIPITTKKSNYVCPDNHIDELKKELIKIDRVLIIGWKANDKYLVTLLQENIKKTTQVTIVSKSASTDIMKKLQINKNLIFNSLSIGFTDFIKNGELDKFFNTN